MTTHVVGLDIGSRTLRAVEVKGGGKKPPSVIRYHEVDLSPGAVRGGEVAEVGNVTTALRRLWSEAKFGTKDVVLGMGSPKVMVRDLSVPRLAPADLKAALPSFVNDMLPMPASEALLDFYPISESTTEAGVMANGLLIATVKEGVLANVETLQGAGLNPVSVDLIPFALMRTGDAAPMGNVAHIDVGGATTNVLIASNGVPQFVRIMAAGGDGVNAALRDRAGLDFDRAEQLKRTYGIAAPGSVSPDLEDVCTIVRESSWELLTSLRNTLAYFSQSRNNEVFSAIVLSGGASRLPGFSAALREITGINIMVLNPFTRVGQPKMTPSDIEPRSMHVALGLALGAIK